MTVTWDGGVVPCCYDYDKKYVLGNVKDRMFAEIWNGDQMRELHRQFVANEVSIDLCRRCPKLRR